jgi:hypothetical protein
MSQIFPCAARKESASVAPSSRSHVNRGPDLGHRCRRRWNSYMCSEFTTEALLAGDRRMHGNTSAAGDVTILEQRGERKP